MSKSKAGTTLGRAVSYLKGEQVIKTAQDVANSLGYSKGTVSAYISGKTVPSSDFITKFENHYGLKLSDFEKRKPGQKFINTGLSNQEANQRMYEMILANNALTKVLKAEVVALKASVTGKSISSVNLQIEKDAEDQLAHDLSEYEKNAG